MEFTGCDPLKHLEPTIELSHMERIWDIHNDGIFLGFSYSVKERVFILNWQHRFEEEISLIKLRCLGVVSFAVTERDKEMPFSEDDCLAEVTFDELKNSFLFKFMGGQKIKIVCKEIVLETAIDE